MDGVGSSDFPLGGSNFEVYVSPVTVGSLKIIRFTTRHETSREPYQALSGNTLQQLANEKLTASWQGCEQPMLPFVCARLQG